MVEGVECVLSLDCELEAPAGARVLDGDGDGVLAWVPEENDANTVTLAEREFADRRRGRAHGISTSLTRATVVRSAT